MLAQKAQKVDGGLQIAQGFTLYDGLVTNVWVHHLQREDSRPVIVKGYCFASLKAKTKYTVRVLLKTHGEIAAEACTCVAGKGQACSPSMQPKHAAT